MSNNIDQPGKSTSPKDNPQEFIGKKILIIVENLPCPFDRRVWQEAIALKARGARVSIICPVGKGYEKRYEKIDDIAIYRHPLPIEGNGAVGYLLEYGAALYWELRLTFKVLWEQGFDVIHACNPPDLIYLVAKPFTWFGKKFLFDHHDINPELYVSKFNRRDFFYKLLLYFEKQTFRQARVTIATNASYREIALTRGHKAAEDVFIVRSSPMLEKWPALPPRPELKKSRTYLVGYVGVMGKQEGLHFLIEACHYLVKHKKRNDIHFLCIGDGTERENIMTYALLKGVADYFTFTGRIPDKDLLGALNTADVCVNPDTYNALNDKSTMNKILEYMALKKPVVQFDLTEGRFSAQQASLYARPNDPVDLAEKLLELLADPQKRQKMGDWGYERLRKELAWEYQQEELYRAYRKLFSL
jgi:glycosyltransferase involved in cell wall biosynthesis